nr:nucleotide-binding, alpha-beta plait [Tanacetum cinerariifolium]
MQGDETHKAYLNHAQEHVDALAAIDEPVKDKDLVMLVVLGLREEYSDLKTTITTRQSPTVFSEIHARLSDHDYILRKTRTPASSITSSFVLSALVFQVSSIAPMGLQAFYDAPPSHNNKRSNNNNNHGNRNNSHGNNNRGHDTQEKNHVKTNLPAMDNSHAYYGDDALHVTIRVFLFFILDESTHTTLLIGPSKHNLYTINHPQLKSINKVYS